MEGETWGDEGDKVEGALGAGGAQRGEDLPGGGSPVGFVAAGELSRDDRAAQLTLGQVVGSLGLGMIQ
ncbi:MAG TPA: hypothetical protein VIT91_00005, partial [Chthoniobacterales bacterium]